MDSAIRIGQVPRFGHCITAPSQASRDTTTGTTLTTFAFLQVRSCWHERLIGRVMFPAVRSNHLHGYEERHYRHNWKVVSGQHTRRSVCARGHLGYKTYVHSRATSDVVATL